MTKQREPRKITNKPAPMLPGLYSMQAVGNDGLPDVTVYRHQAQQAIRWKNEVKGSGVFSKFLLRHAIDAWDVYDRHGRLEALCDEVVHNKIREQYNPVAVDRQAFFAEATAALGEGVTCVAMAEGHAASSAADHSNFAAMTRIMVTDASPKDIPHLYMVESSTWPCRVIGLFARFGAASPALADQFLDRYEWLSKGWPLNNEHHAKVLTQRLGILRKEYLYEVFADAMRERGEDEESQILAKFRIAMSQEQQRTELASKLVECCASALSFDSHGAPEKFDNTKMSVYSEDIVDIYERVMLNAP